MRSPVAPLRKGRPQLPWKEQGEDRTTGSQGQGA
ncbi:unnamed protein product [Cyprideis torosa]|uniref:Uncharacterized protein n=1 Tax=Cyprideis torosa TaxID=163714 RepID=A0A7R8ZWR0_9CRUS|nr:unnamed protein product [Cyprideis torosa]CAG0911561.1 unnamed protein product [Cyprideis torosa]